MRAMARRAGLEMATDGPDDGLFDERTATVAGSETTRERPIRVLVADDHPVVRFGLVSLLEAQAGIEVVAEAKNCSDCCRAVQDHRPDIVVLDLEMGDCQGVEALERLQDTHPEVRVLVYTTHDEEWLVTDAVKVGVHGFVRKDAPRGYVVEAVRAVANGMFFLDPQITSKVVGKVGRRNERRRSDRNLSQRETDVLRLVAEGLRNKEISSRLFISERTVKFHMSSLMGKLGAGNRTEAVRIAMQNGLIATDGDRRGGRSRPGGED